jgi:ribosomal protein L22
VAKDAGTKQDAPPSDRQPDAEVQEQQAEAKQAKAQQDAEVKAAATEEKPPKKAAPKRKPAAKKASGTAAAKTKVEKGAAETAAEGAEATEDKPKPKRTRKPAAKKESAQPEPAPKPATRRRREADELVTVRAQAKFVRSSARKARLIADHVRGKDVNQALAILAFSPRSVAEDWEKVLKSAIANAEHNHDLVGDDLRVLNATADEGPTLKRFRPRAQGRATRIRKRTSHLTITLTPKQ